MSSSDALLAQLQSAHSEQQHAVDPLDYFLNDPQAASAWCLANDIENHISCSSTSMATTTTGNIAYRPVATHWFYNKSAQLPAGSGCATASASHEATTTGTVTPTPPATPTTPAGLEATASAQIPNPASSTSFAAAAKTEWTPFSAVDSQRLQQSLDAGAVVCASNGGRYDVNLPQRRRVPVYWEAAAGDEVRLCSWFCRGSDSRLVPYEEAVAVRLEAEYRQAAELGKWNRKVALPNGDTVVLHGPNVMVQFSKAQAQTSVDTSWTESAAAPVAGNRPRIVKRGLEEWTIEDGESEQVDHLMFMVHGIGAACDLKFRTVEQVGESFAWRNLNRTEIMM